MASKTINNTIIRKFLFHPRRDNTTTAPGKSRASRSCASAAAAGGRRAALVFAVVMVTITLDCPLFGVTAGGENEHLLPAGRLEQEKETVLVNEGPEG